MDGGFKPQMYYLQYVTATGTHTTPCHPDPNTLLAWVTHLNAYSIIPHFLVKSKAGR